MAQAWPGEPTAASAILHLQFSILVFFSQTPRLAPPVHRL